MRWWRLSWGMSRVRFVLGGVGEVGGVGGVRGEGVKGLGFWLDVGDLLHCTRHDNRNRQPNQTKPLTACTLPSTTPVRKHATDMWQQRTGGWDRNGTWQRGFGAYAKYFHAAAESLTPTTCQPATAPPAAAPGAAPAQPALVPAVEAIPNDALGDGIDERERARFEAERADVLRAQQEMLLAAMGAKVAGGGGRRRRRRGLMMSDRGLAISSSSTGTSSSTTNNTSPTTSSSKGVFMGPAWHNVYLTPESFSILGNLSRPCGYLNALSVHYYCWRCAEAIKERNAGIMGLLDEKEMQAAVVAIRRLVAAARSQGLSLHIRWACGGLVGFGVCDWGLVCEGCLLYGCRRWLPTHLNISCTATFKPPTKPPQPQHRHHTHQRGQLHQRRRPKVFQRELRRCALDGGVCA